MQRNWEESFENGMSIWSKTLKLTYIITILHGRHIKDYEATIYKYSNGGKSAEIIYSKYFSTLAQAKLQSVRFAELDYKGGK